MEKKQLTIAYLQCEDLREFLPSAIYDKAGGYPKMAQTIFDYVISLPAGQLTNECEGDEQPVGKLPKVDIKPFDVRKGEYPDDPAKYDGFIISGALSGVYDDDEWIQKLLDFTRQLHADKRKMVGISFGHQIIAQALGGNVSKNPKGIEISRVDVPLTDEGKQYFKTSRNSFSLMYHHGDTIDTLPSNACNIGGSDVTECQAFFLEDHILGLCGHPDYCHHPDVMRALYHWDDPAMCKLPETMLQDGKATLYQKTDYIWVVVKMLQFFSKS